MSEFHLPDSAAMAAARLEALAKVTAAAPQVEMWQVTDQNGQRQTLPALQVLHMRIEEGLRLLLALHERYEGLERAVAEIHLESIRGSATEDAPVVPDLAVVTAE